MSHATLTQGMRECIDTCLGCHQSCLQTVEHCLSLGGKHASPDHIRLLLDCAEICQVSADFLLRNSPRHGLTCRVCAEVCQACSDNCSSGKADAAMQACAEACKRCAQSCQQMAGSR